MDTRKVTLIATIAAILLLAVGIGYAYTAATMNTQNTVTAEYITLVQDDDTEGTGAYTFVSGFNLEWNTLDSKSGVKPATVFTPVTTPTQGAAGDHMSDCYLIQLGDSFKVLADSEGITTLEALTCSVVNGGTWAILDGQTTYFIKVVNNGSITWFKIVPGSVPVVQKWGTDAWNGGNTFTIGVNGSAYYDTTVTVYYAMIGAGTITETHEVGEQPDGPGRNILTGASLTFTVEN